MNPTGQRERLGRPRADGSTSGFLRPRDGGVGTSTGTVPCLQCRSGFWYRVRHQASLPIHRRSIGIVYPIVSRDVSVSPRGRPVGAQPAVSLPSAFHLGRAVSRRQRSSVVVNDSRVRFGFSDRGSIPEWVIVSGSRQHPVDTMEHRCESTSPRTILYSSPPHDIGDEHERGCTVLVRPRDGIGRVIGPRLRWMG